MPGVGLDIWNEQLSAPEGGAAPAPSRRTDAYTQPIASPPAPSRPPRVHFSQPGADQGHPAMGPGPQGPGGHPASAMSHSAMSPPAFSPAMGPPAYGPSAMGAFGPPAYGPAPVMLAEMKGDKGSSSGDTWKRNDIWISLGLVFVVVLLIIVVFQLSRLNKILSKKFL